MNSVSAKSSSILLIMGNQLFPLKYLPPKERVTVFMVEDPELCTYFRFHKHKIILFLAAMRSYADQLRNSGYVVHYIQIDDEAARQSSFDLKLGQYMHSHPNSDLMRFEIEDKFMEDRLNQLINDSKRKQTIITSPMFLTTRDEFKAYLQRSKKPFMKTFYEQRRKELRILVGGDGKPVGGKWSFDEENRARLSDGVVVPSLPKIRHNQHVKDVSAIVEKMFPNHPGVSSDFWLPVTMDQAHAWLDDFLNTRLENFGRYEDAITPDHFSVFHSVLSPVMNLGLLTPDEIVRRTLDYASSHDIPLNSLEGFIRQVIGWREFIRGIYQNFSEHEDRSNFFKHTGKLNSCWYQAETGLPPLDDALRKSLKFGWAHHIERLMVISNVMLLSQVDPREVYRWFMEMYVDSSDWVMGPNVYGMGQFSDGGVFATKPYVSGSNYILKMSHYKKGSWCEIWDGLYWKFVSEKFQFLEKNPRLSMMVAMWDKKSPAQKKSLISAADGFIGRVTT